jgi:mutator protein MutT
MPFSFCPKCGGKLRQVKTSRPVCSRCHFIFYQNSVPAFGAILIKGNKILLAKRKIAPQAGKWDLPGGFIENGETPERALKRELEEELGIKVQKYKLVDLEVGDYVFQGIKFKTLNLFYLVTKYSGQIQVHDDVASVTWFAKRSLPQIKNWAFRWIPKVIRRW